MQHSQNQEIVKSLTLSAIADMGPNITAKAINNYVLKEFSRTSNYIPTNLTHMCNKARQDLKKLGLITNHGRSWSVTEAEELKLSMSHRDRNIPVRHMLDYASEARDLAHGRSRDDLDNDRLFNLGMTRLLEMIGRAAMMVPDDLHSRYPETPWQGLVDFSDQLIENYDLIDSDAVWQIIHVDLSRLIAQLEAIVVAEG